MKKILLIGKAYFSEEEEKSFADNDFVVEETDFKDIASLDCSQYEAILFGSGVINAEILAKFTNLKLISFMGTGYSTYIDMNYCNAHDVKVCNTPSVNANSVAEFSVALMLDLIKQTVKMSNRLKSGDTSRKFLLLNEIKSLKIGVIGLGNIGSCIARICKHGFGSEVFYTSRSDKGNEYHFLSKEELLKESDVLFLCMDENESSRNYISKNEFAIMKNNCVIVNASRPHLINGADLYDALAGDKIQACAMDGYYGENPKCEADKTDYGLFDLPDDKFIVTAHVASHTIDAISNMNRVSIENIINYFTGKKDKVYMVK